MLVLQMLECEEAKVDVFECEYSQGLARAMTKHARKVEVLADAVDIVGTGGDGANTVNISTGSSILAAACGAKVAKQGTRSSSSACGSADVLEALGVFRIDTKPNCATSTTLWLSKCNTFKDLLFHGAERSSVVCSPGPFSEDCERTRLFSLSPFTDTVAHHSYAGCSRSSLASLPWLFSCDYSSTTHEIHRKALDDPSLKVVAGVDLNHGDIVGHLPAELVSFTLVAIFEVPRSKKLRVVFLGRTMGNNLMTGIIA
ncbi:hypothetical protein Bca52824_017329 [Brassica carinata]|uniref:Glycosyl transferase family 3 domain-containing protein n=1 Tax=Brassica carinata TaxID=52824 RepID=A0A8X7VN49_BRACI|nr:hypothetical protein Bca52824_017329 [Brassica carinata]